MRTVLRLLILPLIILSGIVIVDIVALKAAFVSPVQVKETLQKSGAYTQIATAIEDKITEVAIQNGEDAPKLTIPPAAIAKVAEKLIDQTADFATGKTTTPPSISVEELITSVAGNNAGMLKELKGMQQELMQSLQTTDQSQLSPEERQMAESLTKVGKQGAGTISFGKEIQWIKQVVSLLTIVLPIAIGGLIVGLVLILIISPNAASRVVWLSLTCFLLAGTYGLGVMFQALPQMLINSMATSSDSPLMRTLLSSILLPITDVLFRYHVAAVIVTVSLGTIFLLARLMVFRPSAPASTKVTPPKKSKK